MIVEDEALIAIDIQNKLKSCGFEVVETAPTGKKAIKKAEEINPGLILMDINLRGKLDGIETTEKINNLFDIPIIYMSTFSDKSTFERIKRTNHYGFMNKPIRMELLLLSIDAAISIEVDGKFSLGEEKRYP